MNPVTREAGEMTKVSEPLKLGMAVKLEGMATAPVQKAEQPLHVE